MRAVAAVLALLLAAGCGGAGSSTAVKPRPIVVPARANTTGDALLGLLPGGAEFLCEIDLRRLRANPVVGALVKRVETGAGRIDDALVKKTELVVVAAYNVGTAQAATLTLVRGAGITAADAKTATRIDDQTFALGPARLVDQITDVRDGKTPAVTKDAALMRARALAMPKRANTAAVRLSANLDFEARISMARVTGLDAVPATMSVWADVIDDLAVVALLGGSDPGEAATLTRAATAWRTRLLRNPGVRNLGLSPIVRDIDIRTAGRFSRLVLLIGPRRLAALTQRLTRLVP